jgi:plastocyanin
MIIRKSMLFIGVAAMSAAAMLGCFSEHAVTDTQSSAGACAVPDLPDVAGSTLVFIREYAFHPAEVRVRSGSRITWVNCESAGGVAHTSTADGNGWTSGLISPGTAFTTTINTTGTFEYHCEPHPFMKGTVVVE